MRIEPVTPTLGAWISDVDLSMPLDDQTFAALCQAIDDYHVVILRGQSPQPRQFLNLGRRLGQLEPSVNLRGMAGELAPIHWIETDGSHARGSFADVWHADVTWSPQPPSHIMLRSEILPRQGGDTLWANMEAAYAALDARTQAFVDRLEALHRIEPSAEQLKNRNVDAEALRNVPAWYHEGSVHPVVRVHPKTGRKALFVNPCFTRRILGMSPAESRNLLQMLFDHALLPDFQMRLRWEPDLVVIWDNRSTIHYAVNDYRELRRHWRMTVAGEPPVGPTVSP